MSTLTAPPIPIKPAALPSNGPPTLQDMYGLQRTAGSAGQTSLAGIWTPVPEPSTLLLAAGGGIGLVGRLWRRRVRV